MSLRSYWRNRPRPLMPKVSSVTHWLIGHGYEFWACDIDDWSTTLMNKDTGERFPFHYSMAVQQSALEFFRKDHTGETPCSVCNERLIATLNYLS